MKLSTIKSSDALFFIQPFLMADPFTFEDAETYHHKAIVQWNSAMQAIHDHPLDGNESVLDIGCGDGKVTAYLAGHLSSGKIIGIDFSDNMILFANRQFVSAGLSNITFAVGDISQVAYQEEFDEVVSFFCLHWLKDQKNALERIYSSLKPNGKVLLTVPSKEKEDFLEMVYGLAKTEKWSPLFKGSINTRVLCTADEYAQLMRSAGFANVKVEIKTIETVFSYAMLRDWLHYLLKYLDEEEQAEFLSDLVAIVTAKYPLDNEEKIHTFSKNLQATGIKP